MYKKTLPVDMALGSPTLSRNRRIVFKINTPLMFLDIPRFMYLLVKYGGRENIDRNNNTLLLLCPDKSTTV